MSKQEVGELDWERRWWPSRTGFTSKIGIWTVGIGRIGGQKSEKSIEGVWADSGIGREISVEESWAGVDKRCTSMHRDTMVSLVVSVRARYMVGTFLCDMDLWVRIGRFVPHGDHSSSPRIFVER